MFLRTGAVAGVTLLLTFLLIAVAGALALASRGYAHDFWINHGDYKAPDGSHCCGENDCFEFSADDVAATPSGWLVKPLGETVPYSEAQPSEDGKFWRCKRYDGARRCFFAPGGQS